MYEEVTTMEIFCDLEEFLSILEEYRNKGVKQVEINDEKGGLKIEPIRDPSIPASIDLHPTVIGKSYVGQ
jgi:hypothetical protein